MCIRDRRLQAYFGYLNQARQETIAQLKQTREEVAMQRAELEEKQSEQQTLLYEQRAQQAKLTQALNERKKTLAGLESSIQQGQQQLSELRANESRLRNSCLLYTSRRGEVQAAKAADAHGIPFTLSTVSVCPIEEVAPAIKRPMWFQLYVLRDRGFMRNALERAKAAGCSTLVFTVDMRCV